jgi:hypothetical protein
MVYSPCTTDMTSRIKTTPWPPVLLLVCLILLFGHSTTLLAGRQEQTTFNANAIASEPLVEKSVPVPNAVLQILRDDDIVRGCKKDNPIAAGSSLASWFVASEIHLNEPSEVDLVVLPDPDERYLCFHSVEGVGWFWIFRPASEQYELMLRTAGLSLEVLETKHEGYRDIQSGSQVGKFGTALIFRFMEGHYREYQEKATTGRSPTSFLPPTRPTLRGTQSIPVPLKTPS